MSDPFATTYAGRQAPTAVPWWWQWLDDNGAVKEPPEGRQEFPTRSDAESWIGEVWSELLDQGVAAVTLFEGDREVYGPMPLTPA